MNERTNNCSSKQSNQYTGNSRTNNCNGSNDYSYTSSNEHKHPNQYTEGADDENGEDLFDIDCR